MAFHFFKKEWIFLPFVFWTYEIKLRIRNIRKIITHRFFFIQFKTRCDQCRKKQSFWTYIHSAKQVRLCSYTRSSQNIYSSYDRCVYTNLWVVDSDMSVLGLCAPELSLSRLLCNTIKKICVVNSTNEILWCKRNDSISKRLCVWVKIKLFFPLFVIYEQN